MTAKSFKPAPELLRMWKAINLWCFVILLIGPLFLVAFGAPSEICIGAGGLWLILFVSIAVYMPAFYRSLEYSIDSEAIYLRKGVFWKRRTTVPYAKITNIDITQGPVERVYKLSKLHLQTAGANAANNPTAELMMYGIIDPEGLKDVIMTRIGKPSAHPLPTPSPETSDESVSSAILTELRAIRKALENKE